jgi:hypothetical protein
MDSERRKRLERAVHSETSDDFKGRFEDGTPNILVLRPGGTTLVAMSGLTDLELEDKAELLGIIPPAPPVPCKLCGAKNTVRLRDGRRRCGLCDTYVKETLC